MQYLACLDKLFHRACDILNRDIGIDPMLIEEIDVVCPETLETPIHHPLDMFGPAVQTALLREIEAEFGSNLHFVAKRLNRTANDGLARVRSIHFRSIEECHAVPVRLADDLDGVVDGRCRTIIG